MQVDTTRQASWREPAHAVLESRVAIAFFSSRTEAQQAVDHLGDHGFPIDRVSILANDRPTVQRDTTRLDTTGAAFQGAIEGAMVGLVLSVAISLLNVAQPIASVLSLAIPGTLGGAVVGLTLRLLGQAFSGQQESSPIGGIRAERHVVMVDTHLSREASRLLEGPY